jgi:undecaprenyl-phosphate galactose phosphotransferase/putative colanic acid biosynthesis UDP-glucose lipid carrier transferase
MVKLDSRGPAFFRQRRNGFNNRDFEILKFRTMHTMEDGENVQQACRHDPRVTRVGAFLRRSSIDELPQLINVLRGEMSIVGPRPHAVSHNASWAELVEDYALRHHIKPGITGLAQVNGFRGRCDTCELIKMRVHYDLEYINRWSVWLDLQIIAKTMRVFFFQRTAF